ncbi:hypothetical protein MBLNU459_g0638t1 [Dothideomycetes sp. NU459]
MRSAGSSRRCALLLALLLNITLAFASAIVPRATTVPAPVSFTPDENWDGIDGSWSSFTLRVGTPSQTVRVFASWMSYQTWVVAPQGCLGASNINDCTSSRGEIFNLSQSTTWDYVGLYSLWIEQNLGYGGNAYFGYDVVGLGNLGEGGPTLPNTTVGAFAVTDFYVGNFGLNPKPTNWSSYEDSAPSYMTQLKEQKLIPSVSFGYTAGAPYRFTGVLASLTLGGYDDSRFVENDVEFTFAADNDRDTVVAIQAITTLSQNGSSTNVSLLPTPVYALVDATVPQIWLPIEACEVFEQEFGLVYDNNTDLYLVNSTLHASLVARNANVSFVLGQTTTSSPAVTITLPYASFDLTARSPYQGLEGNTAYFPLRRATNDTQYTLGRTFMQEAYITVNYERAVFNISQCDWVSDAASHLVAIEATPSGENSGYGGAGNATTTSTPSASSHSSSSSSRISGGAIGGIVAGAVVAIIALAGIMFCYRRRVRKARSVVASKARGDFPSSRDSMISESRADIGGVNEKGTQVIPKAELEGSHTLHPEKTGLLFPESVGANSPTSPSSHGPSTGTLSSSQGTWSNGTWVVSPLSPGVASEADGEQLFEMPGDMPDLAQADGRQISEKDMMKRREEIYNGVDLNPSHDMVKQPVEERQQERERRMVQPEEVAIQASIEEEHAPRHTNHERFSFEGDEGTGTNSFTATASPT